jgi:hypothetical protein
MPPASDWKHQASAEKLMQLNRSQFALEFLRRNPRYKDDYQSTLSRIATGELDQESGMEQLARRWGLTFPASAR